MKTLLKGKNKNFLVSTVNLNFLDGYQFLTIENFYNENETMVFECDENGKIVSYEELYCNKFSDNDFFLQSHKNAILEFIKKEEIHTIQELEDKKDAKNSGRKTEILG